MPIYLCHCSRRCFDVMIQAQHDDLQRQRSSTGQSEVGTLFLKCTPSRVCNCLAEIKVPRSGHGLSLGENNDTIPGPHD